MGDPYFWCESIKFPRVAKNNLFAFSSINGASRILNLNLILIALNLFCYKVLWIYLRFKHFYLKKLSYCHQYIFWLLASSLRLSLIFLNCSWFFDNLNLNVPTKCVLTKKSVSMSKLGCNYRCWNLSILTLKK